MEPSTAQGTFLEPPWDASGGWQPGEHALSLQTGGIHTGKGPCLRPWDLLEAFGGGYMGKGRKQSKKGSGGAGLAQSGEHATLTLRVVGLSPTVDVKITLKNNIRKGDRT